MTRMRINARFSREQKKFLEESDYKSFAKSAITETLEFSKHFAHYLPDDTDTRDVFSIINKAIEDITKL